MQVSIFIIIFLNIAKIFFNEKKKIVLISPRCFSSSKCLLRHPGACFFGLGVFDFSEIRSEDRQVLERSSLLRRTIDLPQQREQCSRDSMFESIDSSLLRNYITNARFNNQQGRRRIVSEAHFSRAGETDGNRRCCSVQFPFLGNIRDLS